MKTHHSPEYKFVRPIILLIYRCKCAACGFQSAKNHVHHNDRNAHNNDPFNLVVLCADCHKSAHKHNFCFSITNDLFSLELLKQLQILLETLNF